MAAITDVRDAWAKQIATISDEVARAEATLLLENYISAMTQQAALEAQSISSYSIGGRSVTRRDPAVGQSMLSSMRMALHRAVYGGATLVDLNTEGAG